MNTSLRRLFAPALLAIALTACGGQSAGSVSTPGAGTTGQAAAAPTRTPRPAREPTARPTDEALAKPTPEPLPTAAEGEIMDVQFGALQTYEHPSGVFALAIPENWELQDNSKPDEIIMIWTDPTRNGGVIVDIFEDETAYSTDQLTEILKTFLQNSFGSEPDFSVDDPKPQSDDSILMAWSYTATADNDTPVELLGNSFIEQRENKVSIITTLVPRAQFEDTVEKTDEIINTYTIDASAPLVTGAAAGGDGSASAGEAGSFRLG